MKPATPLPWEIAQNSAIFVCRDGRGIAITNDNDGKERYQGERNAAYIVHAANAYPEIVAALRSYTERTRGRDLPQDIQAAALLAKLGE